jgi:oxalate---CoA ligase
VPSSPVASSVRSLLVGAAQQHADSSAVLAPGRQPLTYRDLAAHLARTARHLRQSGVATQSRVAVVLPNGAELATTFAAVASCSVVRATQPGVHAD